MIEKFDVEGRMYYNPSYHFSHGKRFTLEDLAYLAKFYEIDGYKHVSMALGKTEATTTMRYTKLKQQGLVEHYRALWDTLYEKELIKGE